MEWRVAGALAGFCHFFLNAEFAAACAPLNSMSKETGISANRGGSSSTPEQNTPAPSSGGDSGVTENQSTHTSIVSYLNSLSEEAAPATANAGPGDDSTPDESPGDAAEANEGKAPPERPEAESGDGQEQEETEQTGTEDEPQEQEEQGAEDRDGDLPQGVRKTLHELREQRRQLREERETLKTQLGEVQEQLAAMANPSNRAEAANQDPLQRADTPDKLRKIVNDAEAHIELVEDQLDRVDRAPEAVGEWLKANGVPLLPGADGTEDMSPEALKEVLRKLRRGMDRTIRKDVPARYEFLQARARDFQNASSEVDWVKNPKSPEMKRLENIYTNNQAIFGNRADAMSIIIRLVEGDKVIEAQKKARAAAEKNGGGTAKPVIVPSAAAKPGGASPRSNVREVALTKARDALKGANGRPPTAVPILQQYLNT